MIVWFIPFFRKMSYYIRLKCMKLLIFDFHVSSYITLCFLKLVHSPLSLETMMSKFIFDTGVFSQEVAGTFPAEGLVGSKAENEGALCCELLEYK